MGNEQASSKFQQLRQQPRGHDSSLAVNSDRGGELPASPPQLESPRQQQRRMSSCAMENSRRSESPQPSSLPIGGRSLYQQQLGGTNRELPLAPPLAKNHLPQTPNSHLLSPCNRTRRNRRMSVAGDHEALRRELAKAADANTGSGTGSGGQTPQRRFSRATPNSGGSSRKLSSIRGCDDSTGLETTTAEHLKLTSYQMQILQQSWPRIRSQGALSGLFRELAQTNSAAKEMFQKMSIVEGFSAGKCCDQKEHVRMLVELIEFALQNLNAPCKIVQQKCHSLGELHYTGFGATNESKIWDDFGECLSKCLAKAESVRGKREAFRAWCTLTTFMVESMRAGYVQHFKRRSLTRHSSGTQLAIVQLATVEEVNPNGTTASITATSISTSSKVASNSREKRSITPTFPPFSTLQL